MNKEEEATKLIKEILEINNCTLSLEEEYMYCSGGILIKQNVLYLHRIGDSGQVIEPGVEFIRGL